MPGYKKKGEKENKAQHRRMKKEKRNSNMGEDTDDFMQLNNQLVSLGLVLKQIPGDGNCLFRALGDQLDGNPHEHIKHRDDVVRYMLNHREDFEPFVEDDISFDQHIRNLSEPGSFGGNDSIVAFARLHNLSVVIHQLDKPLWQIHGGPNGSPGAKEAHISYHNGDHYNSVRRCGDMYSSGPAGVRLSSICKQSKPDPLSSSHVDSNRISFAGSSEGESDYENLPSSRKIENLIDQVSRLSGISDRDAILDALDCSAYKVQVAVEMLRVRPRQHRGREAPIWSQNGSATRILGTEAAGSSHGSAPSNKNLSAKRLKEMKKRQQRLEKDTRGPQEPDRMTDTVMSNLKTLTI